MVSKLTQSLWAKKRSENGKKLWLPLIDHLLDTKNVIGWLFEHWLSRNQRKLLILLDGSDPQSLLKFIGFVHDIGKATPAFQTKCSYNDDQDLDKDLINRLVRNGFIGLDKTVLSDATKSPHAMAGEAILDLFGVPDSISAIVGGHHGKPLSRPPLGQIAEYTKNYKQDDHKAEIQNRWISVWKDLLQCGLHVAGYSEINEIPSITQPQAVLIEGLLIMSDWLASSESLDKEGNQPLFPLIPDTKFLSPDNSTQRFQNAIKTWKQNFEPWEPAGVDISTDPYKRLWGFNSRPIQKAIIDSIIKADQPELVIIEAPMGIGKTEVALLAAEQLAFVHGQNGLFMGLPTQATTNAMLDRVVPWLDEVAQDQGGNLGITLQHGKARFNSTMHQLPQASNVDMDNDEDHYQAVSVNSWFSGKKSILVNFSIGTIDNLLLMGLKQKHLFLRHLGFSGKVVIIDEVHAYDVYMSSYLFKALEWLGAYHVPVIMLSATLPKDKKHKLVDHYLKGKLGGKYRRLATFPDNWDEDRSYPALTMVDNNSVKTVIRLEKKSNIAPVTIRIKRSPLDGASLAADVVHAIKNGGVAGVIVNTVQRAQDIAKIFLSYQNLGVGVLHSGFLTSDRSNSEKELQNFIGKNGKRPDKMVIVGTQVLEQSLDIDFDILYTDIAPIDLLLQRIGRLHRHKIPRPKDLMHPTAVITGINGYQDYDKGSEMIYGNYLLSKTDHFLGDNVVLPKDISPLVQDVYDKETDIETPELSADSDEFHQKIKDEQTKASAFQIKAPDKKPSATLHGWLDVTHAKVNEQTASAAVRDIRPTLEVILLKIVNGKTCLLDSASTLLSQAPPKLIAQQKIRIPFKVTPDMGETIDYLEHETSVTYPEWQNSSWLKGELAITLNEQGFYELNGWRLSYSTQLGLLCEKEANKNGK